MSNLTCDFCNQFTRNVDVTDWRKPSGNDVTFELEAPPVSVAGQNNEDNYNVVFVFDISGSMGNTTEVGDLLRTMYYIPNCWCDTFLSECNASGCLVAFRLPTVSNLMIRLDLFYIRCHGDDKIECVQNKNET